MTDHFEESNVFDASLSIWKGVKSHQDGTFSYEDESFDPIPLDLYTAASLGEDDFVQDILDRKEIRVNSTNSGGWTPLMYASYMGHTSTVQLLLDNNADPDKKNRQGLTPIILASLCGNERAIASLIQKGADLEAKDKRGWTALFHAASSGHQQTTKFLLEVGVNIEVVEPTLGLTPLLEAVASGHELVAQQLLENGADMTRETFQGENVQSLAANNSAMINLLNQFKNRRQKVNRNNQRNNRSTDRKSESGHSGPSIHAGPKAFAEMTGLGPDGRPHPHSTVPSFLQDQPTHETEAIAKPVKWEGPKDLESLLSEIGCNKYLPLFKEQDVDLQIFLTLSEADLKEIGISLFGPRRKMESVINRLMSDVRTKLGGNETAYADGLNAKLQIAESKLKQAKETKTTLETQLTRERELRGVTESVLLGHNDVWTSLRRLSDEWATAQTQLGKSLDQIRSVLQDKEKTSAVSRAPRRDKQENAKLMKEADGLFRSSRDYMLEMRAILQSAISSSPFISDKPKSG